MAFGMRHTAGNGNISINELEQVLIEVKFFPVYIPCNADTSVRQMSHSDSASESMVATVLWMRRRLLVVGRLGRVGAVLCVPG